MRFLFLLLQGFSHSLLILLQFQCLLLFNDGVFVLLDLDTGLVVIVLEFDCLFVEPLLVKSYFF